MNLVEGHDVIRRFWKICHRVRNALLTGVVLQGGCSVEAVCALLLRRRQQALHDKQHQHQHQIVDPEITDCYIESLLELVRHAAQASQFSRVEELERAMVAPVSKNDDAVDMSTGAKWTKEELRRKLEAKIQQQKLLRKKDRKAKKNKKNGGNLPVMMLGRHQVSVVAATPNSDDDDDDDNEPLSSSSVFASSESTTHQSFSKSPQQTTSTTSTQHPKEQRPLLQLPIVQTQSEHREAWHRQGQVVPTPIFDDWRASCERWRKAVEILNYAMNLSAQHLIVNP